jgi:TolB protein
MTNRDFPLVEPDGTVTFDKCKSEIYVMDADDSNPVRLTYLGGATPRLPPCGNGDTGLPAWSPDGRQIAFEHFNGPNVTNYDIYVMDADGTNIRQLTDNPRVDATPSWSPDGKKIAFESARAVNGVLQGTQIYVMNADGTDQRPLTNPTTDGRPNMSPSWGRGHAVVP